jgi:agmatinase
MTLPTSPRPDLPAKPFDPSAPAHGGGIYGLPHSAENAKVVLMPVPWEPTTSYGRGTARGPSAILQASRQVDLFDIEVGKPYEHGVTMLDVDPDIVRWNAEACAAAEPIIEAGGEVDGDHDLCRRLARVDELSTLLNERVAKLASNWLSVGKIVGILGGDHSAPFGAIEAHAERFPGLGILHIDAHADLRRAYEGFEHSHASIMYNVAHRLPHVSRIVQAGLRDVSAEELDYIRGSDGRIRAFFDVDISRRLFNGEPFSSITRAIVDSLPERVYISFDIDGLDPALCPHTGTPVPGGFSFQQAVALLAQVHESRRRIVGFDLNEVAPGPDGDEWDGNVGARLLYKMIGFTLLSQQR